MDLALKRLRECSESHNSNATSRSQNSDLERTDLFSSSPHEEIKQLHGYFAQILGQIDSLKETVAQVKSEQAKAGSILHRKNSDVEKLSKEIRAMKKNYVNTEKLCEEIRLLSQCCKRELGAKPSSARSAQAIKKQKTNMAVAAKSDKYCGGEGRKEAVAEARPQQKLQKEAIARSDSKSKPEVKAQPKKSSSHARSDTSISSDGYEFDEALYL